MNPIATPTSWQIGYCTNVHAGPTLAATRENLEKHALGVKQRYSPEQPMGLGLWLTAEAARSVLAEQQAEAFAGWLAEAGLLPFTFNGFPYGDFHQPVVKQKVYLPTWFEKPRLQYTLDLIEVLHALLPAGLGGSISTLPIAWSAPRPDERQWQAAAEQLREVAARLARLEQEEGRYISLCLEPEPGCLLQKSDDVLQFFEQYLLPGGEEAIIRRHIQVCHDVCHAVVMFEPQREVLRKYAAAGIGVGKVQISSAVTVDFDPLNAEERAAALAQLGEFAEDRYLHQTVVQAGESETFYEDLPQLLAQTTAKTAAGKWAVHFHVPVYLERFGCLGASQAEIIDCIGFAVESNCCSHFEVETYAWGVLPPELQQQQLAAGIAQEMNWFSQQCRLAAVGDR